MSKNIVEIGDIKCGSKELFLISGPCVIEDLKTMENVAEKLLEIQKKTGVKIIYKSSFQKDNRSSSKYYRGPGLSKGLEILSHIKSKYGFSILTDVHYPSQIEPVSKVVDVIQIPAYLCMQTDLVETAAKTNVVINIKHGQFLSPENMIKPTKKIEELGNKKIILTERGYTFGYNDLIVDPRSFYDLAQIGYPVVFDITHSIRKYGIPSSDPKGGLRQYLSTIARAGVAAGVDGIFIETHPSPENALCDAASQLNIKKLENFITPLIEIHKLRKKYS